MMDGIQDTKVNTCYIVIREACENENVAFVSHVYALDPCIKHVVRTPNAFYIFNILPSRVYSLSPLASRRYARELAEGDESIAASWKRVREGLHLTLSSLGLDGVGRVKASEQRDLQRVLDEEIPSLRRQAAPVQFSFFGTTSKKMG